MSDKYRHPRPLALGNDVWRWLHLIAKAESDSGANHIVTADEIADAYLRQHIREQHPALAEHQKALDKLEKQLIESLRKPKDFPKDEQRICGDIDP